MSDFINSFWSYYVAVIVVLSFIGLAVLLQVSARARSAAGTTTGHIWDESLQEMNNPLPRWWMWLFIITLVFGVVYLILFPGVGSYRGVLGWTSVGSYDAEVKEANAALAPIYAKYAATPIEELIHDEGAMGIGERIFLNNCAQCHGSDARGSKSFPDLTGSIGWRWGGTPDKIKETITNGRMGIMPPQAQIVGSDAEIEDVANYVLSLSGSPASNPDKAKQGEAKFKTICAACHGPDGKGNQLLGAQDLTQKIWQHGWNLNAIVQQIHTGRTGQMPSWQGKLTPEQIHVVAAYVWGLSHKGSNAAAATDAAPPATQQ